MFFAQLAVSMGFWIGTIVALYRRRETMSERMKRVSRGRRAAVAVSGMLISFLLLGLGMSILAMGGMTKSGLSLWGWPFITIVGAAFIALQTGALVPLVLNAATPVTREGHESSDRKDSDRL